MKPPHFLKTAAGYGILINHTGFFLHAPALADPGKRL